MSSDIPRSPTLEDVAQVAGVSRATVSRVINGVRNVDPELHQVVWRAVSETGYVPNRAARSLVTRRTGNIALLVSDSEQHTTNDPFMGRFFTDPYFGRVVGGVLSELRPRGLHLALMLAGDDDTRVKVVGDLRQGHADGVVIISLHPADPLPGLIAEAQIPAVLFGRPSFPVPVSYVDLANDRGAAMAADKLVELGKQRIVFISGPQEVPSSQDRLSGFRQAMARHGHAYVPSEAGMFTLESGQQAMKSLLAEHPDLDGVFVFNDLMAQGALIALHDLGRRVPEDVAVIGFDDSSPALSARPALTTIRHPIEDMAAEAVRMLIARIDDPATRVVSQIFEPTLVRRQSA
jgi:DNA-binding LacI/PurR family transcriptional regulator